ncbi:HET-domain-containing protein [Daldinia vernicosa]|uniref:HET-domain-containing protein n=1 Tax=Daldinia vernicosa TaxID=114800 RepID=UPI0020082C4C|nr:HET-domain-containing protein [Daldinia vernicosa]KAI0845882.1 HET-domain-containing protein [Daldinia vernicosa]
MAQTYVHEPLPSSRSIRLISLAPSVTSNAPIQCDIIIVELHDRRTKVPYEALSYVWGSPTGTIPIRCKGMELLVTPNCHDALLHLRFRFSRRILWIDAICIDQGDDDRAIRERNSQVQMMGDVYENASRVLIWLGLAHQSTPRVFRMLRMIGFVTYWPEGHDFAQRPAKIIRTALSRRLQGTLKDFVHIKRLFVDIVIANGKESKGYTEGLQHLLGNRWFFRVWTMQEAVFARKCVILCGNSQLDWTLFNSALGIVDISFGDLGVLWLATTRNVAGAQIRKYKNAATSKVSDTSPTSRDKMPSKSKFEFERMDVFWIRTLGHLQCSVPQDKVYGLYSIFRATGLELPDVDYKKTVQEVYGDIAKSFIRMHGRSLNVLLISIRPQGHDDFPSWTPNWEMSHLPGKDVFDNTGNVFFEGSTYRASGYSLATTPSLTPATELQVRGFIVGGVRKIIVSSTAGKQPELVGVRDFSLNFIVACRAWLVQLGSIWEAEIYQGQGVPINALINTLAFFEFSGTEDLDSEQLDQIEARFHCWADVFIYPDCDVVTTQDIEAVAQLDPSLVDYPKMIEAALDVANIRSSGDIVSDAVKRILRGANLFHSELCFQLANWAFLFLETGHIGRAYFNCREGDKVALLAGSNVPFILREVEHHRYQLVAPAYIYGIMNGELWPADEIGVEDITLV